MKNHVNFFSYAILRETIRLKRLAGHPPPWVADEILQTYRFCNVYREDDTTTKWFAENVRSPMDEAEDANVLFSTIAFRWFNNIAAGEQMLEELLGARPWNFSHTGPLQRRLQEMWETRPLINSAYIIITPKGHNKLNGLLMCLEKAWELINTFGGCEGFMGEAGSTLEGLHTQLTQIPYMGAFMAYEVVTDLANTSFYEGAPDRYSWACAGPGAARGLARVMGFPIDNWNRNLPSHQKEMCILMQGLMEESRHYALFKERPWTMREVEHTLCEFDKYERARLGEGRPKQLYRSKA